MILLRTQSAAASQPPMPIRIQRQVLPQRHIASFSRDVTAFSVLRSLQQPLSQVPDMLDDSMAVSGSDAMNAALAY